MKYTKIRLFHRIETEILAVGAQSKGAFCLARGGVAYLSDPIGDLSVPENFKKFEKQIKFFQKKFKIRPEIVACDLHPEYLSTKYALRTTNDERRTTKIQHHEAHVASCIADNRIKGRVIGIAFDGTGFGRDRNIWGGEFFIGSVRGFKRVGHLKYIPMPGGEACVREPWRMAFSYLYGIYGSDMRLLRRLRRLAMTERKWPRNDRQGACRNDVLGQMIDKKINSPLTSSVGRLFDGVSSLIGVCDFAGYEGEAAVKLERTILTTSHKPQATSKYKFKYIDENGVVIIDWGPVIKDVVKDLKDKVRNPEISSKFHIAICEMIKDVCVILRKKYRINKVCMSGGVFQNRYISSHIKPMLEKEGFEVYAHKKVPAHDGGIALGQAILARFQTRHRIRTPHPDAVSGI